MGEQYASFVTVNLSRRNVKRNVVFSLKCAQSVLELAASEMSEINFRSEMKQALSFNSCLSINAAINASSGGYFIYGSPLSLLPPNIPPFFHTVVLPLVCPIYFIIHPFVKFIFDKIFGWLIQVPQEGSSLQLKRSFIQL